MTLKTKANRGMLLDVFYGLCLIANIKLPGYLFSTDKATVKSGDVKYTAVVLTNVQLLPSLLVKCSVVFRKPTMADVSGKKNRKSYNISFKLEAVEYAEKNSKEAAARRFNVHPKQIREWCKIKEKLSQSCLSKTSGKQRKKVEGSGRKPMSSTMEEILLNWIEDMRSKRLRVTRNMILIKARELFERNDKVKEEAGIEFFAGSIGWLSRFFKRNGITLRRRTTLAQKMPEMIAPKLVNFILYVRSLRLRNGYQENDIIAMDETAVWLDMTADTTVEKVGVKSVPLKTTGHEKNRITVVLAAKASGRKLKPMMVFKGEILFLNSPLLKDFIINNLFKVLSVCVSHAYII